MQYKYLGSARNVRELMELLVKKEINPSATLTLQDTEDMWSYVEVLVSETGDDILIQ